MSNLYPAGDYPVTFHLGLALYGMDETLAENMILIDAAVGGGGSGAWASLTGNMTETQVAPWDGPTVGVADTGISRDGVASLAIGNGQPGDTGGNLDLAALNTNGQGVTLGGVLTGNVTYSDPQFGATTGGLSLTDTYGNVVNTGASAGFSYVNLATTLGTYMYLSDGGGGGISFSATGVSFNLRNSGTFSTVSTSGHNVEDIAGSITFTEQGSGGMAFNDLGTGGINLSSILGGVSITPVTPPTSVLTAGVAGQITPGIDGHLYFCSVGGAAGSATWNVLSMTAV